MLDCQCCLCHVAVRAAACIGIDSLVRQSALLFGKSAWVFVHGKTSGLAELQPLGRPAGMSSAAKVLVQ